MEGGDGMNAYVTLCDQCFSDLYRVAKIAVCDSSVASELVKKVCVAGVSACKGMEELREIKATLMRLMYLNCLKYFENAEEMTCKAPVPLHGLTDKERLLASLRHCSGLRFDDVCFAVGMRPEILSERMQEIAGRLTQI